MQDICVSTRYINHSVSKCIQCHLSHKVPSFGIMFNTNAVIQDCQTEIKVQIKEMEIKQDDIKVKYRLFSYTLHGNENNRFVNLLWEAILQDICIYTHYINHSVSKCIVSSRR